VWGEGAVVVEKVVLKVWCLCGGVVYGQDADLLLLTLLRREPYFRVMREDMQNAEVRLTDISWCLKFFKGW
jgi:hypothetical protein